MIDEIKEIAIQLGLGALFAGLMGVIGYVHKQVRKKEPVVWVEGIVRGLGSGGTGLLVMMACRAGDVDIMWTGVIVGTLGWLGADFAVATLMGLIKRIFNL